MIRDTIARLRQWLTPDRRNGHPEQALVLSGGGARASYQAGVLQYISEVFPDVRFPILTGVSAGAINAAHLASHTGTFRQATDQLAENWHEITSGNIFQEESSFSLLRRVLGKSLNTMQPGDTVIRVEEGQALLKTAPLRDYLKRELNTVGGELRGVTQNLGAGRLKAFCVTATSYTTGQSVTWVQGSSIHKWQRPNRVGIHTMLTVDHIMASAALPLLFPAVKIGDAWYGDGGIRLLAPLSPAVHLGADSILVVSTRYDRSRREADAPSVVGYPPAAQVMGLLMNAIFLDVLDQDALMMRRINDLIRQLPHGEWEGYRPIKLLMLRPSKDLGRLASQYDLGLRGALKLLTKGLGTEETASPDWLSMLLFDEDYVAHLMELGWYDARSQHDRIADFFDPTVASLADEGVAPV